LLPTLVFAAAILVIVYRRMRRSFGRQRLAPRRAMLRIVSMASLGTLVALLPWASRSAVVGGLAVGVALAVVALRHTRFEYGLHGAFHYTPNAWVSAAVVSLFAGRLVYRFLALASVGRIGVERLAGITADPSTWRGVPRTEVTVAILLVLVGYYVAYYAGVLSRSRRDVELDALETPRESAETAG